MKRRNQKGFSLIELMVAVVILVIASLSVVAMFEFSLKVIYETKARVGAVSIANEIAEMTRNLPYNDIGTEGGLVSGVIPQTDIVTLNGIDYEVNVSVDYYDDSFDGTVALGTDELGNDYKIVKVSIVWEGHYTQQEVAMVSTIAPKGIETDEGQGILWINVIDANGEAVSEANIHIINEDTIPQINDSSHQTNEDGYYYSSVPAANDSYNITVSKSGYSSDYTCAIEPGGTTCSSSEGNPDPTNLNKSVIEGYLTETTFRIDLLATLNINTVSQTVPTEWQVNTDSNNLDQYSPAVNVGYDGNYYFTWQDFQDFAPRVYAQKYNEQTVQWTPDKAITSANNQGSPDLAVDSSNDIYFTWHDDINGNQDIYLNKFTSTGNQSWGSAIKVNTDSSSANQIYPRVVFNASTTNPAVYVAWKDERVGGGNSDIYLQKFDSNGNNIWSSELKVNLNSSSMYTASDSSSWVFDNQLNYVCDSGNCDGSTDIEITGDVAQLIPIKTCNETPDDCDTFSTELTCTNQSGCSWDEEGPCEGPDCDCTLIDEENNCNDTTTCNWTPGDEGCSGNCSCSSIGDRNRCLSVSGCSWFWFFCYSDPGCSCDNINIEYTCEDATCDWGASQGTCDGSCSCNNLTAEPLCTETSCSWDLGGPCGGNPEVCSNFLDESSCISQSGCDWSESGSGYPIDNPELYPIESLVVENLSSWDSFTETATKNGGEIYYQLSDDDGSNWKYWNGSNWALASATDYNTALTINSNISNFPIVKGKIMFKAFFSSNGSQQIQLDQIDIGYSYSSDGGGYSQSVDLAVYQDVDEENIYVVWEDYQIDNYDTFIQKVDAYGNVEWANDVRVNTSGTGNQNNPTISTDNSNNVYIFWQDDRNGDTDIYGQKYDSSGNNLWGNGDVAVSISTGDIQVNPKTVTDGSNDSFIAWQDGRNGSNDIYCQKINSNGIIQWTEDIRINSNSSGDQKNPDVALNSSENLVVTWQDNSGGNYNIIAAEYTADPNAYSNTPNVPLVITGEKQIGNNPVIYKYSQDHTSDASGNLNLTSLEWDTYNIELQGGSDFTIVSCEPPLPISLNPGETIDITLNLD